MKTMLTAIALAATLAEPAAAITFPSLTTIYVGSGVRSSVGTATTFHCSNVSGVPTQIRFLILSSSGFVEDSITLGAGHGQTLTVSTDETVAYSENQSMETPFVGEGAINIESLQSGVFCTAKTIDFSAAVPTGMIIPLVRVNPHPGTVE